MHDFCIFVLQNSSIMITIKINERSKKGKTFLEFAKTFIGNDKDIEFIETEDEKSPYNPEFVEMVLKSAKRGKYTTVDTKDIWGSLGLK